jgi:hypothetical protein
MVVGERKGALFFPNPDESDFEKHKRDLVGSKPVGLTLTGSGQASGSAPFSQIQLEASSERPMVQAFASTGVILFPWQWHFISSEAYASEVRYVAAFFSVVMFLCNMLMMSNLVYIWIAPTRLTSRARSTLS